MAHRITPNIVTVTKDGECHIIITLDINININNEQVQVSPEKEKLNSDEWAIPEFGSFNSNLLSFGKDVEHATDG